MSEQRLSQPHITDPVSHLYSLAESLLHLGDTLPEQEAGLALLLCILGEEVRHCAALLDHGEKENP